MNIKTIEGLVGANNNMKLVETPLRVYKEACQQGDTATMERSMGYAGKFTQNASEYIKKAETGLKEDAKTSITDTLELSDEGKMKLETTPIQNTSLTVLKSDTNKNAIIYTSTGENGQLPSNINLSITV